jgi:hypothetical protein
MLWREFEISCWDEAWWAQTDGGKGDGEAMGRRWGIGEVAAGGGRRFTFLRSEGIIVWRAHDGVMGVANTQCLPASLLCPLGPLANGGRRQGGVVEARRPSGPSAPGSTLHSSILGVRGHATGPPNHSTVYSVLRRQDQPSTASVTCKGDSAHLSPKRQSMRRRHEGSFSRDLRFRSLAQLMRRCLVAADQLLTGCAGRHCGTIRPSHVWAMRADGATAVDDHAVLRAVCRTAFCFLWSLPLITQYFLHSKSCRKTGPLCQIWLEKVL